MNTTTNGIQDPDQQVMWGDSAPKGGRAVLNRILKDAATVPLFFGQTLINSLRDLGYNSTTSALCEHVDNAIQWGATEVRVYFNQKGKRGNYKVDVAVLDNGKGMPPNTLKVATSFGGSMVYGQRGGIGKYGMGMKAAALSISPTMDLYSWQEPNAIYNMMLDVEAISRDRSNLIELPEPTLFDQLPGEIAEILTKPMAFPEVSEQELLCDTYAELNSAIGGSGTLVYMPNCDRLSSATARTLTDHAIREMSRVYRRFLGRGLNLFVNNRRVEAFDPTYSMHGARHTRIADLGTQYSRLVAAKDIQVPRAEDSQDTVPISVRVYALPIESWDQLPRKVLRNDLHLYDDNTVSVLRNDREVFIGTITEIARKHGDFNWIRIQIDFSGELDEAFGVAANKQGIRPKKYVLELISDQIGPEISALRDLIKKHQAEQSAAMHRSTPTTSEFRATETEGLQSKQLPVPSPTTDEERAQLDENLRTLAVMLKRDFETDEDAFIRVKDSKYVITYKHDEYWPFYHVDYRYGKTILTINTAHPFYGKLYEPISRLSLLRLDGLDLEDSAKGLVGNENVLVALQLMFLSLARTENAMSDDDERQQLFDQFKREWSNVYRTQLMVE